jgi:hypothetical protein
MNVKTFEHYSNDLDCFITRQLRRGYRGRGSYSNDYEKYNRLEHEAV